MLRRSSTMSDDAETPPLPTRGNKTVLLVIVSNVAIAGVLGALFLLKGGEAKGEEGHGASSSAPGHGITGVIFALDPIIANLNEPGETRYLKVTVQLEIRDALQQPHVEAQKVAIRDRVLMRLSSLTAADTRTLEQKRAIQQSLLEVANDIVGAEVIRAVYFTEFVVQ
jgi:flagellar FliL protein